MSFEVAGQPLQLGAEASRVGLSRHVVLHESCDLFLQLRDDLVFLPESGQLGLDLGIPGGQHRERTPVLPGVVLLKGTAEFETVLP